MRWRPAALILSAGLLAYASSFQGAFVFDDEPGILENPRLRRLWPIAPILKGSLRPLVDLTLALNYALGGLDPWGYHAVNVALHLGSALLLYGLLRRTPGARPIALPVSLLWVVHPLTTQAVTYIIQRAELLAAAAVLGTLYSLVRSAMSPTPDVPRPCGLGTRLRLTPQARWHVLAIASCALGMLSKPVVVSAPLLALAYDRTFLAGSLRSALRARAGLYAGLVGTWGLLAFWLAITPLDPEPTFGFRLAAVTPLQYLATQPGVVLHYLRLSLWPHPLVIDYGWPAATALRAWLPQTLVLAALIGVTLRLFLRRHLAGFFGLWVLLSLAPSSSVIPIADLMFEHRMYLALAGVLCLVVLAAQRVLAHRRAAAVLLLLGVAALGLLTARRNLDYRSNIALWRDAVAKRPGNARAHTNLGFALQEERRLHEAVIQYAEGIRLGPAQLKAHSNLALALADLNRLEEAAVHCQEALRIRPNDATARLNCGVVRHRQGRLPEAVAYYEEALRLRPEDEQIHLNLGMALAKLGRFKEAIARYEEALRLNPAYVDARVELANLLAQQGRGAEAMPHYAEAFRLHYDNAATRLNFGVVLYDAGRFAEAAAQDEAALRLEPENADAHNNLGNALIALGRPEEAMAHFAEALRINPALSHAHYNLGNALAQQGRREEAMAHYTEALRLQPGHAKARHNLELLSGTAAAMEPRP
jgi:tetratricopeptide (TPR) repeat protein